MLFAEIPKWNVSKKSVLFCVLWCVLRFDVLHAALCCVSYCVVVCTVKNKLYLHIMYISHVGMVTVEDTIKLGDNVHQSKNATEAGQSSTAFSAW